MKLNKEKIKSFTDKTRKEFSKITTNFCFLKHAKKYILIDNDSGNKIATFLAIQQDNKLFIKTSSFDMKKKSFILGNKIINSSTYELFAIKKIEKENVEYLFDNKTTLCKAIEIKKITNF